MAEIEIRMESDLTEWTSTATDSGDLTWDAAAGLAGSSGGMACLVDDINNIYGEKSSIGWTSGVFNLRIHFKTNGLTMANGDVFWLARAIVGASANILLPQLGYTTTGPSYRLRVFYIADPANVTTGYQNITDGEHWVEIHYKRASSNVAADGEFWWKIDGTKYDENLAVDIYDIWSGNLDKLQVGAPGGLDAGTSGTFYVDEVKLNNTGATIGGYHAPVSLGGTITPAGTVTNRISKVLAGVMDWAGGLVTEFIGGGGGGDEFFQAVGGTLTSAGALINRTAKALAGAVIPDGGLVKRITKSLAGVLTPEGVGNWAKEALLSLAGSITPAGEASKRTAKPLAGTVTPDGSLAKQIAKALAGALDWAGSLATQFSGGATQYLQSVAGTLNSSGEVVKRTARALAGSITPDGTLTRMIGKALVGVLTPVGTVAKRISKALAGVLSWVGSLTGSKGDEPGTCTVTDAAVYPSTFANAAVYPSTFTHAALYSVEVTDG